MKVRMELPGNSDFLTVHCSAKIHTERYSHEWLMAADGLIFDGIIRSADGVNGVHTAKAHEVTVERSPVFSDKEVFDNTVKALHVYLVNKDLVLPDEPIEVMESVWRGHGLTAAFDAEGVAA